MPASTYDLYIEQGATFRFTMVYGYRDGTLDVDGNPVLIPYDITGCDIRMQIRQRRGTPALITATTGNGAILIDDPTGGKFVMSFTSAMTNTLTMKRAAYDIEVEYPSGDVLRILQGKVNISPNITQDADPNDDPVDPPVSTP
jgi:hypothetical protein